MPTQFLRLDSVKDRYGLSKSTIYKLMNSELFPLPIHVGRSARWSAAELEVYDAKKAAERVRGGRNGL